MTDYAREPILHAGIEDCLPEDHPLAHEDINCEACGEMVHAHNNETMQAWVEGGLGAFCLACFGSCPDDAVMHWLPGHKNAEDLAYYRESAVSSIRQARKLPDRGM
jgi:hypothetical protein